MKFNSCWHKFRDILNSYPNLMDDLKKGADNNEISECEKKLGLKFPGNLKTLYKLNNGQKGKYEGIFKAVSGFRKFTKLKFLDLDSVYQIWKYLNRKKDLDVFSHKLIPIAVEGNIYPEGRIEIDDVYCIDSKTNIVYLLWTSTPDFTLPPEWQTAKLIRGKNLTNFIEYQILLY